MKSLFGRLRKAPAGQSPPAPMPMLSFSGKKALPSTGDTPDAERDTAFAALVRARNHVVGASGAAETATTLRTYINFIYATEVSESSNQERLRFVWRDNNAESGSAKKKKNAANKAAAQGEGQGHTSLAVEWAVALFTLAAELSHAAAAEDRREPDGIRRACSAFCDAAGALRSAAGRARSLSEYGGHLSYMTAACLTAFEGLMLTQALECYFELAVAGGKPLALCSKIARKISLGYHDVSLKLGNLPQQPIDKSWVPHAQAKAVYFHAEANLLCARSLRELRPSCPDSFAEALARLRLTVSVLDGASAKTGPLNKKSSSSSSTAAALVPVRDAAARLRMEAQAELAAANNDHTYVFFARVLAAESLTELPVLTDPLVRPTPVERVVNL